MALITVKHRFDLGRTFVLAPERYDPRRQCLNGSATGKTVPLGTIASTVRQTINPQNGLADQCHYMVLDTSDVREGVVIGKKEPVTLSQVGSAKKIFERQDVLISRLRPYLRQVAFVDDEVVGKEVDVIFACSTEFFVLRSKNTDSIAFLIPFLLSSPVQNVLAASQEGGHHPRFDEEALLTLPIPETLLANRADCSAEVIRALALYRESERILAHQVRVAEGAIAPKQLLGPTKRGSGRSKIAT